MQVVHVYLSIQMFQDMLWFNIILGSNFVSFFFWGGGGGGGMVMYDNVFKTKENKI